MVRIVANSVLWLLAALALVYVGDWAVWRARGGPTAAVTVGLLQVANMKGNKEEYFPDGTEVLGCSRSLFPQSGAGACWWVERQKTVFER